MPNEVATTVRLTGTSVAVEKLVQKEGGQAMDHFHFHGSCL